jgi:hopanoid biosynthesis associated RND transporter like protein HpnN
VGLDAPDVNPPDPAFDAVGRRIVRWTGAVGRHASRVLLAVLPASALLGVFAFNHLGVNTDTGAMIDEDLPWRHEFLAFREAFPQFGDEIHVVIDGRTPELAAEAQRWLTDRMREEPDLFERVWTPGSGAFFDRNALLYLDQKSLDALVDHVEHAAPWIRRLERSPDLAGLVAAIDGAIHEGDSVILAPILNLLARTLVEQDRGWRGGLSWQEVLQGRPATPAERRRHIVVVPRYDYALARPAGPAMDRLGELRARVPVQFGSVQVRFTGAAAIKHESISAAMQGASRALVLSILLVTIVLTLGLRSSRLILASLLTLGSGLAVTAAFAAAVVGQLNLISIAFAVLYVGLGIDYCIHLCLGYREALDASGDHDLALREATGRIGSSIFLSALTSAAAFYAFVPTRFTGVAELGVISGTGMLISLAMTLTLLPALLTVLPPPVPGRPQGRSGGPTEVGGSDPAGAREPSTRESFQRRHRGAVLAVATVLGLVAAFLAPRLRFAYRPIDLLDPETESVRTYEDLSRRGRTAALTVSILAQDSSAARRIARTAGGIAGVGAARTIDDMVPDEQVARLERIREISDALGARPASGASGQAEGRDRESASAHAEDAGASEVLLSIDRLQTVMSRSGDIVDPGTAAASRRLSVALRLWRRNLERWPSEVQAQLLANLNARLVGSLPDRLHAFRTALEPRPITRQDVPDDIREWWIAADGRERVELRSALPLDTRARLSAFVDAIRRDQPRLTGVPVSDLESGRVALRALTLALVFAISATLALLLIQFRSLQAALLVELPLLLAGVLTIGIAALVRLPFTVANLIALPLLLGVGVDNGIHMVHRARSRAANEISPERTSTGRAIVVACFTTIAGFVSLALSDHRGIASMGQLLTIGMLCVLTCTLFVIPAALSRTRTVRRASGRAAVGARELEPALDERRRTRREDP